MLQVCAWTVSYVAYAEMLKNEAIFSAGCTGLMQNTQNSDLLGILSNTKFYQT